MIDEYGLVTREVGDKIEVRVDVPGACESCPISDNCNASGKLIWLPKQGDIHPKDYVRFSITSTSVLKITALVYGLPFAGVVGGIVLGYLWFFRSLANDPKILLSVALGTALLLISGFALSRLDRSLKRGLSYTVVRATKSEHTAAVVPKETDD